MTYDPNQVVPEISYNKEGEEEEEEEPLHPAKHQRTGPAPSKSKVSGKSKSKGKARANTPALVDTSTRFPIPVRKPRRKSKKGELPAYVPPQPVSSMDTVSLAAETLANQRVNPYCSTQDAPIASSATMSVTTVPCAPSASTARRDTCPIAATPLWSPTMLMRPTTLSRGNELITDLSAARADYELAREQLFRASACIAVVSNRVSAWICGVVTNLGPHGLPHITEIPEDLRPLWGQLLIEAEAELSVNYRAAIMRYPFISDPCQNDLPTDEDLPTLIEFLTRHATCAH
ncbi:hypothetical protein B0H14DRAFT_2650305 [Mycena olivaceomarginata]|nr:hypothetical protein B0H14DRAFT_2650305 [Mycena olivaceomarginata]